MITQHERAPHPGGDHQSPTGRRLASAEARLAQLIPGINRFLLEERPSLILLHQIRSGSNQLVHYLARQALVKAVWTGAGLLPHTLFLDNEGLDGNSLAALRSAHQYRAVAIDEPFLDAALTAVLGHHQPAALARRMVQPPTFRNRLRDAVAGLFAGNGQSVLAAFTAWQRAQQPAPAQNRNSNLPADPFVAVLLQRELLRPRGRLRAPLRSARGRRRTSERRGGSGSSAGVRHWARPVFTSRWRAGGGGPSGLGLADQFSDLSLNLAE